MSAVVPAMMIESPVYHEAPGQGLTAADALRELVHELRQPLSSIEAIAYYVEMTLPPDQLAARQQLRKLQELVLRAESILEGAASTARIPPAAPAGVS